MALLWNLSQDGPTSSLHDSGRYLPSRPRSSGGNWKSAIACCNARPTAHRRRRPRPDSHQQRSVQPRAVRYVSRDYRIPAAHSSSWMPADSPVCRRHAGHARHLAGGQRAHHLPGLEEAVDKRVDLRDLDPDPRAIRARREPSMILGLSRSAGVMEWMIASIRSTSRSSMLLIWSLISPMPGNIPKILESGPSCGPSASAAGNPRVRIHRPDP